MLCCSHAHSCSFNYKQRTKEPAIFLSWVQHRERTDKNFLMSESEEDDFRRRLLCRLEAISTDYACGLGKYRTTRVKSSACDWCGANRLSCSHCKCASRESKESNTWTKQEKTVAVLNFLRLYFAFLVDVWQKAQLLTRLEELQPQAPSTENLFAASFAYDWHLSDSISMNGLSSKANSFLQDPFASTGLFPAFSFFCFSQPVVDRGSQPVLPLLSS